MKILLLLLMPFPALAQYFTVDPHIINMGDGAAPGIFMTGGGFLKNTDDKNKRTFRVGVGIGVFVPKEGSDPYFPLFIEGGYFNKSKHITPVVTAQVGYGFYKGGLSVVKQIGPAKGGLYAGLNGGIGIKVSKFFFLVPNAGMTIINLRHRGTGDGYSKGMFNAGLSLLFAK